MTKVSGPTKPVCLPAGPSGLEHRGQQLTSMTSHSPTSEASNLPVQRSQ